MTDIPEHQALCDRRIYVPGPIQVECHRLLNGDRIVKTTHPNGIISELHYTAQGVYGSVSGPTMTSVTPEGEPVGMLRSLCNGSKY